MPHRATPATLDMVSIRALAEVGQVSQNDGDLIAPEGCAGDTESALRAYVEPSFRTTRAHGATRELALEIGRSAGSGRNLMERCQRICR
jgi:hypothetical protein